jgi:hypothetical protein
MTLGQQVDCMGNVHFPSGKNAYKIVMGGPNHPNTDLMRVTCNAVDAKGCKDWTVAPSNPSGQNVVDLQLAFGTKVLGQYGTYRMAFSFHVTRP